MMECSIMTMPESALKSQMCFQISSVYPKNKDYCCDPDHPCAEKTRLCPACVKQGETKDENNLNKCRTVDVKTGLCKFHKENGEEARRGETLLGANKDAKKIQLDVAKAELQQILAEVRKEHGIIRTEKGSGKRRGRKRKVIDERVCAGNIEIIDMPVLDPECDSDAPLSQAARDLIDEIDTPTGTIFCALVNEEVTPGFCEAQSSQHNNGIKCSKDNCESPWRVCPACALKEYNLKAGRKKNYFVTDPVIGYCEDHAKYGPSHDKLSQKVPETVRPPTPPEDKKTETDKKQFSGQENAMKTGKEYLPIISIIRKELGKGSKPGDIISLLKIDRSTYMRLKGIAECGDAVIKAVEEGMPISRASKMCGVSEDKQADALSALEAGDMDAFEKVTKGHITKPGRGKWARKPGAQSDKKKAAGAPNTSESNLAKAGALAKRGHDSKSETFDRLHISQIAAVFGKSDGNGHLIMAAHVDEVGSMLHERISGENASSPINQILLSIMALSSKAAILMAEEKRTAST